MKTTRILWSGLTGRTGRETIKVASGQDDVKIISGICRTVGFGELAHDVLEIAKVMTTKPVKKDGTFYDLDELWDNLVSWAL